MAIRTVVTRGFGNGTFNGTIPLVVTRGYAISQAAAAVGPPYCVLAREVFAPGAVADEIYQPGTAAREVYAPGAVEKEVC